MVLFEYCNLKNDAILGELRINGIINREQQQKIMSETVPVTANKIVREALMIDPSESKLKTFGEILKRSESDANQKLADGIATFLQPGTYIPDEYVLCNCNGSRASPGPASRLHFLRHLLHHWVGWRREAGTGNAKLL